MTLSPWKLTLDKAIVQWPGFRARLDLTRPGLGLQNLELGGAPWEATRLLGVQWGEAIDGVHSLSDCYARGDDVIATYAEDPQNPFAPQLYWRVLNANRKLPADGAAVQVELLVSVQTQLLDAEPRMVASSKLRPSEIHVMEDAVAGRFVPIRPGMTIPAESRCLLLRLAQYPLSYVEMVHPLDRGPGRMSVVPNGADVEIRHTLIACRMEKGVIIRARLRGCLIPRSDDVQAAAALYEEFACSELPLSA